MGEYVKIFYLNVLLLNLFVLYFIDVTEIC